LTSSRPHVAGVLYAVGGDSLYVSRMSASRKARNIAANPSVSVCVLVRRAPVEPPSSIRFAATAAILDETGEEIQSLAADGSLGRITGHGELTLDDGCFLRLIPERRINTYGIGLPLHRLIRDPLHAAGSADRPRELSG
jgi:hypothetical protein